jgi:DNA-binding NarL/FixJ family response regulator
MRPLSIAMVEDSENVQQMMRSILAGVDDMELTDVYGSAEEALHFLQRTSPDIFIVDLNLPGSPGDKFIREAREILPETQFMVYTVHDDDDKVFHALRSGPMVIC